MIPTWMIEELERNRRERREEEPPRLRIEAPRHTDQESPPEAERRPEPIVIEL